MKRYLFPLIVTTVAVALFLLSPKARESGPEAYAENAGRLLVPQHNVAIAVVDLKAASLSLGRASDLAPLRKLHADFSALAGVEKVESILNAFRVISQDDDIVVSRAIPADESGVTDAYLARLSAELPNFPELSPYVNGKKDTLLFYVYFDDKARSADVYRALSGLQEKWKDRLPFDFTGKAPIVAKTESLLTGDIVLLFPLLAIFIIAVFFYFKNVRAIAASVMLMLISMGSAYALVRFLGFADTPLLLLFPLFSMGLLSDYAIHYFYHFFHNPDPAVQGGLGKILRFPLSLTALSTITGFLSLIFIKGSGHLQLGILISAALAVMYFGVFFWLETWKYPERTKPRVSRFSEFQGRLFVRLVKYRYPVFVLIGCAFIWGAFQLGNLSIEPYPIEQLPESTTIKKADRRINDEFYGTVPFFIEIDTGEKMGIMKKETLIKLDGIHRAMKDADTGYAFSLLTVLKRMNYYFMGAEDTLLTSSEFDDSYDALIEQYLLYYSSGVDPLEYESLLDNSYRVFSIKGLLYYRDYGDMRRFLALIDRIRGDLPETWTLTVHGATAQLKAEYDNLAGNWLFSFLFGSILIFLTVLLFYRRLGLALISLLPAAVSMVISFGCISLAGIKIDAFSIIFMAIITGLVVDYSIHTLVALDQLKTVTNLAESFGAVIGFSGVPIFLSFLTTLLSFMVLLLSSFSGARALGFIMIISLVLSFIFSLYLIPLIVLPNRMKKEADRA